MTDYEEKQRSELNSIAEYTMMKGSQLCTSWLETAMFLEDLLNVKLSDAEITEEILGSESTIFDLVQKKRK